MTGYLFGNLILFTRLLRHCGFTLGNSQQLDLLGALRLIDAQDRRDVYFASRAVLVRRREDIPLFDAAFDLFWKLPPAPSQVDRPPAITLRPSIAPPPLQSAPAAVEPDTLPECAPELQATLTYSAREALRHKDFADLNAEELSAVRHMMTGMVWQLGERQSRRMQAGRGALLDLRRTVRRNLKYGGEIVERARRAPKRKPRPLVVIADISGSMERYARLLLQFIYALSKGLAQPVESFVFSTRLTRISRQMKGQTAHSALKAVSGAVPDWSGGTRIGEALKTFNFKWARRVLGRGAVVLLISDGWDRGDPDTLRREIRRLQGRAHRLIWLNPLLGSPDYAPLTRGMLTTLPYLDDFLPAHNLVSLESLAQKLATLPRARPARR